MDNVYKKHLKEDEKVNGELKNVALRIGNCLRESGIQKIDSKSCLDDLKTARTFLEFYYGKTTEPRENSQHSFFFDDAPDVSPSLALDQLNDIISAEEECVEAEEKLKKKINTIEDSPQDFKVEIGNLSESDSSEE